MQEPHRQVARMLHEEHVAVFALLQRLDAALTRYGLDAAPAADDPDMGRLLDDLAAAVEVEIATHFAFEEDALFPLLVDNGEAELVAQLSEEHRAILPAGEKLARAARTARAHGFTQDAWPAFRQDAADFTQRLARHAEAEEAALVPLLDDLLDEDEDGRLSLAYAAMR